MKNLNTKTVDRIFLSVLIIYTFYLVFRSPEIFIYGRFFAEEGSQWWSYSIKNSFVETLMYSPSGGYFCLSCNLQIALTKFFNIKYQPLLTVWTSYLFFLLPSILFYTSSKNNYSSINRLYGGILLIIIPSMNFLEAFVNILSTPLYLAISFFIIIYFEFKNSNSFEKYFKYFIIFLALFSYYYSIFLIPFVLIKLFNKFEYNYLFITLLISVVAIFVHLNIYYFSFLNNTLGFRNLNLSFSTVQFLEIIPLSTSINLFSEKYYREDLFKLISTFFVFFSFYKSKMRNKKKYTFILLIIFQMILIYFGSAGSQFYGRYAVVISSILFLFYIDFFIERNIMKYFVIYIFFISIFNFYSQGGRYFIDCNENCVVWPNQITNVESNVQDLYIHWPIGEGDPFWFTSVDNPVPTPSPTIIKILGEKSFKLSNINLKEVLIFNFKNLNTKY